MSKRKYSDWDIQEPIRLARQNVGRREWATGPSASTIDLIEGIKQDDLITFSADLESDMWNLCQKIKNEKHNIMKKYEKLILQLRQYGDWMWNENNYPQPELIHAARQEFLEYIKRVDRCGDLIERIEEYKNHAKLIKTTSHKSYQKEVIKTNKDCVKSMKEFYKEYENKLKDLHDKSQKESDRKHREREREQKEFDRRAANKDGWIYGDQTYTPRGQPPVQSTRVDAKPRPQSRPQSGPRPQSRPQSGPQPQSKPPPAQRTTPRLRLNEEFQRKYGRNIWDALGIDSTSMPSLAKVKKICGKLYLKHHPDKDPDGDPEEFRYVFEACGIYKDPSNATHLLSGKSGKRKGKTKKKKTKKKKTKKKKTRRK